MATSTERPTIVFPRDYDERREYETPLKGWLGDVVVQLEDGSRYGVFFYDPIRLRQDLDAYAESGSPFLAEPGLIVLPEVNTETIRVAVDSLASEGFFERLRPLEGDLPRP